MTPEQASALSDEELNLINKCMEYDRHTGLFTWKKPFSNKVKTGQVAGHMEKQGYWVVKIKGKRYKAHRVAMAISGFNIDNNQVDHINGNRADNRLCNLRLVTHSKNQQNQTIPKNNTSGVIGVYWIKSIKKWNPLIKLNGKTFNLGYYSDKEVAVELRQFAEQVCGFHQNHGRPSNP